MLSAGNAIGLGILTVCINITLMLIKIGAGVIGNSYALIADGIESAGDIFTSLITWAGFQMSLRPPDEKHPYGHGKIESLAGLVSGFTLLGAAGFIAFEAIMEIRSPHGSPEWFTFPVLILVVIFKELLSRRIMAMGRDLDSRALEGDAWHHRSDAITSGAAALGIAVALIGGPGYEAADDWGALLACGVIVLNGLRIVRHSFDDVLDSAVGGEAEERVRQVAGDVGGVVCIEKCRLRKSGINYFVELHVQVDGAITVTEGHRIGHEVKGRLMEKIPRLIDVVVHLEPDDED